MSGMASGGLSLSFSLSGSNYSVPFFTRTEPAEYELRFLISSSFFPNSAFLCPDTQNIRAASDDGGDDAMMPAPPARKVSHE